jgi:hypothetical protein
MKTTILTLLLLTTTLLTVNCSNNKQKEWKYEIHGFVNTDKGLHEAIWYTDTIDFDGESLFYHNSDGTKVTINPPFILHDHSLDSTYVNR